MNSVRVAATQMRCSAKLDRNLAKAESLVREAAAQGAQIVLLQELFESLYFCQVENPDFFQLASSVETNPALGRFSAIARELAIGIPISFFEKKNQVCFNTVAIIDADGTVMGVYRKTHIPDGPGYEEKYYFNPGDTGLSRVADPLRQDRYRHLLGISGSRKRRAALALKGAEILFYPTAIGSEPLDPDYDSRDHWRICMQGTCRRQYATGGWHPTAPAKRPSMAPPSPSMGRLLSRTTKANSSPRWIAPVKASSRPTSIWIRWLQNDAPGDFSGIGDRIDTIRF